MITAQQIKARLNDEKDPLQYLDRELSRCASQMGDHCGNVRETLSIYGRQVNKDEALDLQKLKSELGTKGNVYVMDEPTTGLHMADVERLMGIVDELVDAGNTVIVIEHNLDVIKRADREIDLGPEGGRRGGTIIAEGTPEEVAKVQNSYTGRYLRTVL